MKSQILVSALGFGIAAAAQAAVSPVYVSSQVELPSDKQTFFAPRGAGPMVAEGTLGSVGSFTVADAGATWPDDAFNGAYYLELLDGDHAGLTSAITDTVAVGGLLTLVDDLSARTPAVSPGTAYVVRRHLSLEDRFGPANEAGLASGPNAAVSDQVMFWDAPSQSTDAFFFKDNGGPVGWRDSSDTFAAAAEAIRPYEGVIVDRLAGGALTVHVQTQVHDNELVVPLHEGFNVVGAQTVSGGTLGASGLEDAVDGGLNPSSADSVYRVDPTTGAFSLFFYLDVAGTADDQWVAADYGDASAEPLPAGEAVLVERKDPATVEWTVNPN
jgi:hypothetical protein